MREGWTFRAIRELGDVQAGRQRSPHLDRGELYKYLRVANVFDGYIDCSDVNEMRFTSDEIERYRLRFGDILLNEGQSLELVGRAAMYIGDPNECCFQNTLIRFRPYVGIDSSFALKLFQYCQYIGLFSRIATRTNSIAHLGVSRFGDMEVRVPTLLEQRRIVEILRAWDEAIDKTKQLIAAKEKRIRGMMCSTLTAPHDHANDWIKTTLGEILTVASRRVAWDEEATYRLITVKRACGGIVYRGDRKASEILTKDMYLVRAGDFVISRRQVVHGAWAMATAQFDGVHVSKEYACLVAKPDRLWMPYFDWLSRTPKVRHLSFICSYGVDIEKMVLNLDWLLQSRIVIPRSVVRQKQIAEALDCGDRELQLLRQQLAALQRQKRGLMQKLLTGEWPVRDGNVDVFAQRVVQEAAE